MLEHVHIIAVMICGCWVGHNLYDKKLDAAWKWTVLAELFAIHALLYKIFLTCK